MKILKLLILRCNQKVPFPYVTNFGHWFLIFFVVVFIIIIFINHIIYIFLIFNFLFLTSIIILTSLFFSNLPSNFKYHSSYIVLLIFSNYQFFCYCPKITFWFLRPDIKTVCFKRSEIAVGFFRVQNYYFFLFLLFPKANNIFNFS